MTVEERLEEISGLIWVITREICGTQTWLYDDAHQEGMIRAWERLADNLPVGIAVYAAKQAVNDVVRGRRATGSKMAHGGKVDSATKSSSIFKSNGDGDYILEPADHRAVRELGRVEARLDLERALASLKPKDREVVEALFWEDLTQDEVAARYGVTRQAVSARLRRVCGDLRPLVTA